MSVNSAMTAIADKIRALLGISGTMGLDAMDQNLGTVQQEVDSQDTLLNQALSAIQNKAAGGSGNSGPYSYAEEFIWTAPAELKNGDTVSIPHSLGVEPDGFNIVALETELGSSAENITSNIVFDRSMSYMGAYHFTVSFGIGASINQISFGTILLIESSQNLTPTNINFTMYDVIGTQIIPAGKQYRVLVYKR